MSEFKKMKLAEARAMFEANLEERARNPYAIGMAAAEKATGDRPPLKKSTIVKGHEIAKKIMNKEEAGETYDSTTHSPTAVKSIKKFKGKAPVDPVATHEEAEQIDELSKKTLASYVDKAATDVHNSAYRAGKKEGQGAGYDVKGITKSIMRQHNISKAAKKLAKEEADMLDTSLSDIDASKTGEVYKKSKEQSTAPTTPTGTATRVVAGKTGEAYNTTGITKRVPAVESAVLDIMAQTMQKRKIFEDASNIAVITPEQRQDWLDVGTGKMDVVDYFNKYKV